MVEGARGVGVGEAGDGGMGVGKLGKGDGGIGPGEKLEREEREMEE